MPSRQLREAQWQAIVTAEMASRHLASAIDISDELQSATFVESASACALAESALLHFYLGLALGQSRRTQAACDTLDVAIERLANAPCGPFFNGGFAEVGWIRLHIERLTGAIGSDADYEPLDAALFHLISESPSNLPLDLLHGLVGMGMYYIARLPSPVAVEALTAIVERLEERSERLDTQTYWLTPWIFDTKTAPGIDPSSCAAVGVSHGIAGTIAFLAQLWRRGIAPSKVDVLLHGSVGWLLSQRRPSIETRFPRIVGPTVPPDTFFGWCWGDLGIVSALLVAGYSRGNLEWIEEAVSVGLSLVGQTEHYTKDACMCHGYAGNAHLFNRLYQSTGVEQFRDAALTWYGKADTFRRDSRGVSSFPRQTKESTRANVIWQDDPELLMGAVGVGLCLTAAVTTVEPRWDSMFLMSAQ